MAGRAAEKFFEKVANDVLDASEKLSRRMEEGFSVLTTGRLPTEEGDGGGGGGGGDGVHVDDDEVLKGIPDGAELRTGSPLEGMAESVIGDILDGQVRTALFVPRR